MSATTVQLLRAASEIAGGSRPLAERLGVSEALLAKFLADTLAKWDRAESGPAIEFKKVRTRTSKRERETAE